MKWQGPPNCSSAGLAVYRLLSLQINIIHLFLRSFGCCFELIVVTEKKITGKLNYTGKKILPWPKVRIFSLLLSQTSLRHPVGTEKYFKLETIEHFTSSESFDSYRYQQRSQSNFASKVADSFNIDLGIKCDDLKITDFSRFSFLSGL